ncbi:MAG: DUF2304 domain-containing protein [Proteobacteria bacterium]|nr:DUF2304 domain-containing protein [Pseudomonadota bacterium]MBU4009151.1 DUF2304 domain-containing protein [Pseudomonadota bacterium]
MYIVNTKTYVLVASVALVYMIFIAIKTARQQLDFYDLIMLSMVAFVPAIFTFWPSFAYWIADLAGVAFPFVIMFGALFIILFLFVHRLTIKIHKLEMDNRLLIQETGLLRHEIESQWKKMKHDNAITRGTDLKNDALHSKLKG